MPHLRVEVVTILRAFRPGDIIFIESEQMLTLETMRAIQQQLREAVPEIRCVVLDRGMRVVGREQRSEISTHDAEVEG